MKVVRTEKKARLSKIELLKDAKDAEATEDRKKAMALYQDVLKVDPHNEAAYDRLMIVLRKQKEWDREWQVINKAISAFEDMYASAVKTTRNKKISRLSQSFLKLTGLTDRKGKPLYQPGPLAKWKRRKKILEKKLKKNAR